MRFLDLIEKKQAGLELTQAEINEMIQLFTDGQIPDYQMSAFLMAIYFKGMTSQEASYLTEAMVKSGDQIDLSDIDGIIVDKHSTGGVGDTTTIILAPLVAACGVPVAKMSGRGLGHTGGTIDKLESIKGFHIEVPIFDFIELVNKNKVAVVGQSGNLTPADKKIYALRDVTGTVNSIPLIASSIMSKKIAAGADAIVLDVKVGDGAFMKTLEDAQALAQVMVNIGSHVGRETLAVISDMSQPLGFAVGNALEIKEAIDTLKGNGPEDLTELCYVLGSRMLLAANCVSTIEEGRDLLSQQLQNGHAFEVFKTFIVAQGGDISVIENPDLLPTADHQIPIVAEETGYLSEWVAHEVGIAASLVGAGRDTMEDTIDYGAGVVLTAKVGDYVEKGQPVAILHTNQRDNQVAIKRLTEAFTISQQAEKPKLILDTIAYQGD